MFAGLENASAQQEDSSLKRKAELDIQRLELEITKLEKEALSLPGWLTGALAGLLVGVVGTATTVWVDRRRRQGALDQSVHDKRLEFYPGLISATHPLAVYFPPTGGPHTGLIGPQDCEAMGRAMSEWYFGGGGLIMSVETRDAYFRLARALTLASLAEALSVPKFPTDAKYVSKETLEHYQTELKDFDLDGIEDWCFGNPASENQPTSRRFKDYVFLQRLSSELRTRLTEDLQSRRRPS